MVEQQQLSAGRELVVLKSAALAEHFGAIKYKQAKISVTRDGASFQRGTIDGRAVNIGARALNGTTANGAALHLSA